MITDDMRELGSYIIGVSYGWDYVSCVTYEHYQTYYLTAGDRGSLGNCDTVRSSPSIF